jgi:AraC-like DNA-binding protein
MDSLDFCLYETRMAEPRRETRFIESHYHLPEPRWSEALCTVLRAGRVETGPDYVIERQRSQGYDLLYCTQGAGTIRVGADEQAVGAGQLAVIPGDRPHRHAADPADPWSLLWLRVDGRPAAACIAALLGSAGGVLSITRGAPLVGWFERLFALLRRRAPNADPALGLMVGELWVMLESERLALPDHRLPPALERLTAAMGARPAEPWSSADMQAVAHLSPAQLRRQFRSHLHTTPRAWLRRERIMLAQDMLLRPGARVTAVAEACGFADIYHFSREFRRVVGLSPTEWRRAEGSAPGKLHAEPVEA